MSDPGDPPAATDTRVRERVPTLLRRLGAASTLPYVPITADQNLMTVFGCIHCWEVHGRMTSLGMRGCIYYGCEIPPNSRGLFSCPQCTYLICALCADELNGICVCGGELVHGVIYVYDPVELPKHIRELQSTAQRRTALEQLSKETHMIRAEYESHLLAINQAEEARREGEPLPSNGGSLMVPKLTRLYAKGVISASELVGRIWDFVVDENVDELLSHVDEKVVHELKRLCDSYPSNIVEWDAFIGNCAPYDYHVPQRAPTTRRDYIRDRVTIIRNALHKRSNST